MLRLLLFSCCLLYSAHLQAQNPFIRCIDEVNFASNIRIKATSDGGCALFSPDSGKVYKFNPCGVLQWARKYSLPVSPFMGLDFFITTRKNGLAFFIIEVRNQIPCTRLVHLDSTGNVLWSRLIRDNLYGQTTYSLDQNKAGSFLVYANVSRIGGGEVFNMITKIDENGNQMWTRFYNRGGIWGGALFTEDQGILARTGRTLIKTDSMGEVQWSSQVSSASNSYYYRPVEVTDGFIVNGKNNAGKVFLAKITKTGHSTFTNFQVTPFTQSNLFLHKMANGHFGVVTNQNVGQMNRPLLVEFNAGMQVVRSRYIYHGSAMQTMSGIDMDAGTGNRSPFVAGAFNEGDAAFTPKIFFSRLESDFRTGCDSAFQVELEDDGGTVSAVTTSSFLHPMLVEQVETPWITTGNEIQTICGQPTPLQISISGDSVLCRSGKAILLANGIGSIDRYQWSSGENSSSITVSEPGKYWLTASNLCRGETVSDTFRVAPALIPEIRFPADTNLCQTDSIRFDAFVEGATYRWHDGSTHSTFFAKSPGPVEVEISRQGCSIGKTTLVRDCELLEIPSLFTPNNDGYNDRFVAKKIKGITVNQLLIFNRWGKRVHTSADFIKTGWDGEGYSEGVYFWKMTYTNFKSEAKVLYGTVLLANGGF